MLETANDIKLWLDPGGGNEKERINLKNRHDKYTIGLV
jgi:hypothetical protein